MTDPVTDLDSVREEVEAMIWEITAWRGDRGPVDRVLIAIDRYTTAKAEHMRRSMMRGETGAFVKVTGAELPVDELPTTDGLDPVDAGRKCKACGDFHLWSEFTRDRSRADGYAPRCKKCVKAKRLIYNDHGRKERV